MISVAMYRKGRPAAWTIVKLDKMDETTIPHPIEVKRTEMVQAEKIVVKCSILVSLRNVKNDSATRRHLDCGASFVAYVQVFGSKSKTKLCTSLTYFYVNFCSSDKATLTNS